jgi:uncharacterized membrane protein (UPF0127 family)
VAGARSFLAPFLRDPAASWRLRNMRTGDVLADQVAGAFDSAARKHGLLGRQSWDAGNALVIAPSNAIHTFFMKFPIDVVFVRRDGTVVKAQGPVPPWRLAGALRAYAVIELPGGALARCETRPGDVLELLAGPVADCPTCRE